MTEEICVVIFADPSDFVNETLESVFFDIGISTITVLITPTADVNSTATGKSFILVLCAQLFTFSNGNMYTQWNHRTP